MNIELLSQHNIQFKKVSRFGEIEPIAEGSNLLAGFLTELGEYIDGINETLGKVGFFINGQTGGPHMLDEMEYQGYDMHSVWFDYEDARIGVFDPGEGPPDYYTLPIQEFKEILLMWKEFIQS